MDILAKSQMFYQNRIAKEYRKNDTWVNTTPDVVIMRSVLETITGKGKNLSVLEIGYGTGRYFQSLKNTSLLYALDLSDRMLKHARHPVNGHLVNIGRIKYIQADFRHFESSVTFDLIYSFGVLGEHMPFDQMITDKIYKLLKPKGQLICTLINPFGSPLLFAVQTTKAALRWLGLFPSWSRLYLTGFGLNLPWIFKRNLKSSGFTLIDYTYPLKHYPHYLVTATKSSL